MKVNIVLAHGDIAWIGGRFARELVDRLPGYGIDATINGDPSAADLHYHQIVYGPPLYRPAVGLFTHGSERPRAFARDYDGHLTFSSTLAEWLTEAGARMPRILAYPVDEALHHQRPIRFGVAGRVYGDGRKGEELVARMVAEGYDIRAWGQGWPCPIVSSDLHALRAFYADLDYYIDTSTDEGGCVPAAEAMAMGVPVISHTVGVTRPVIAYERGSWESLKKVLDYLTHPYTYDDFAFDHAMYFLATMQGLSS